MHDKMLHMMMSLIIGSALIQVMEGQDSLLQTIATKRIQPEHTHSAADMLSLESLLLLANLGPRSNFRYLNHGLAHKSAKGVKHVRLIQSYGGYDVYGSAVTAEQNTQGRFTGQMYGHVIKNLHKYIPDPEMCRRNIKHLQRRAIKLEQLDIFDPNIIKRDHQRIIFPTPESNNVRMAYKVAFFYNFKNEVSYPVYYFDACTGAVLMSYDQLQTMVAKTTSSNLEYQTHEAKANKFMPVHDETDCPVSAEGEGGNEKIGKIIYNKYPNCLNVKKVDDNCTMEGIYVDTVDNKKSTSETKTEKVNFICAVGYKDPINGAYGIANDAFAYGENVGEMFQTKYQMDFLDYKPRTVVHYSDAYENAFFNGENTFYGDGGTRLYPLVSVDVVAHELGHAIIAQHSGLRYEFQSGGMNEAFSDIAGAAARAFAENTQDINWMVGADIDKIEKALRYMFDPPLDGRSIKNVNDYYDGLNVHHSSGIYNFAFYTMVKTEGMDLFEAFKCFVDANLNYWKPDSDFYTGACDVLRATYDNGFDLDKVRAGFQIVGINLDDCKYSAFVTSMFAGESRDNILVSATRSPILKIEIDQTSKFTLVEVSAQDKSTDIHIVVGKNDMATSVITKGNNSVRFDNSYSYVYVQLKSDIKVDVPVQIKITS